MKVMPILKRAIRWQFHHSFTIVITILQPMLWLLLYTQVAKASMVNLGIENYVTYIFVGLIFLVSFGACSSSGIMNYLMKNEGSFYRIIRSPINRSAIILGQVIESVLCSLLEIAIMLLVGLLIGLEIYCDVCGVLMALIIITTVNFCVSNFTYLLSLVVPNEIIYETLMNAVVLPVFFLSPALFPISGLQGILAGIIKINPFTYAINTIRSILLFNNFVYQDIFLTMIIFLLLGSLLFLFALKKLKNISNY